jgi:hypothetical protein
MLKYADDNHVCELCNVTPVPENPTGVVPIREADSAGTTGCRHGTSEPNAPKRTAGRAGSKHTEGDTYNRNSRTCIRRTPYSFLYEDFGIHLKQQ